MDANNRLTFEQGCDYTGYRPSYMYRLTAARKIPHYKRGRKIYFLASELEAWLLANPVKTSEQLNTAASTYVTTHK
jgi:DNA binding domain, excisionase family